MSSVCRNSLFLVSLTSGRHLMSASDPHYELLMREWGHSNWEEGPAEVWKDPQSPPPNPFLGQHLCILSLIASSYAASIFFFLPPHSFSFLANELCVVLHCMDHISAKLDFSCCSKIRNLPHPDQHINVLWCLEQDRLWGRGPKRIQRKDLTVLCHSWGWWIIKLEQICDH